MQSQEINVIKLKEDLMSSKLISIVIQRVTNILKSVLRQEME